METRNVSGTAGLGVPHDHASSRAEPKPYVVTLDLMPLLSRWTRERGFKMPSKEFLTNLRADMRDQLTGMFENVVVLDERDIRPHLVRALRGSKLPVISLDHAYCPLGIPLHVTRAVTPEGKRAAGLTHRSGSACISEQMRGIASHVQGDVILVDDVIFSGSMLVDDVIPCLRKLGVNVVSVVAGVGIGQGISRVREVVSDLRCIYEYTSVVDEICERDFYPGVPLSGRTVVGAEHMGMPYMLPFGDPGDWASIPQEHIVPFSIFCIRQTMKLYAEIERRSRRNVRMCDLPRSIYSLPIGNQRVVSELGSALARI